MSYEKVGWKDYPDTSTPVNAENLNHMDEKISSMDQDVENLKNVVDNMNLGDQVTFTLEGTTLYINSK